MSRTDTTRRDCASGWRARLAMSVREVRWWRELLLVAGFYGVYDTVRGIIGGGSEQAQRDGLTLLHAERTLHLDPEHWLNNHIEHVTWISVPVCYFYATLHFVVTPAVLIWAYRSDRVLYARARTVLALVTAAALIGFWRFPTAPPRLLAGGGFHDTLADFGHWGWWGTDGSVPRGATAIANQFAAMPSLHVAWACWCGATIIALTRKRWIRPAAICYPVLTALVVMATANHYLLDVLAGAALWATAHAVTGVVRRGTSGPETAARPLNAPSGSSIPPRNVC